MCFGLGIGFCVLHTVGIENGNYRDYRDYIGFLGLQASRVWASGFRGSRLMN